MPALTVLIVDDDALIGLLLESALGEGGYSTDGVPNIILIQKPFAEAKVMTAVSHLLNAAATAA